MRWFKEQGWLVHNASPGLEVGDVDMQYDIEIHRPPFSFKHIKAYFQLKRIIETNHYDLIHVHNPMGAVLGRLAAVEARKKGTKVIYTAHGFHFFKGAPWKNWILYYPIEKFLSRYTDVLVTINQEDFERATLHKLASGGIYHIDGVGVDLSRFREYDAQKRLIIRSELGLNRSDFVALYTAQFIVRKNHRFIIRCVPDIIKMVPNFRLILAGNGPELDNCKSLVLKLNIEKYVKFLGGRSDIPDLCGMADIHVASSYQEGQGINNIEAMAAGCPIVVSNVRGHRDVCLNGRNGFLFNLDNPGQLVESVSRLAKEEVLYNKMSENNLQDVLKYSIIREVKAMAQIYVEVLN